MCVSETGAMYCRDLEGFYGQCTTEFSRSVCGRGQGVGEGEAALECMLHSKRRDAMEPYIYYLTPKQCFE